MTFFGLEVQNKYCYITGYLTNITGFCIKKCHSCLGKLVNISSFHPFAVDLFLDLVYYLLNFVQCIHLLLGVVGVHVGQLLNLPQLLSKHILGQSRHTVTAILREQYFFQFLL